MASVFRSAETYVSALVAATSSGSRAVQGAHRDDRQQRRAIFGRGDLRYGIKLFIIEEGGEGVFALIHIRDVKSLLGAVRGVALMARRVDKIFRTLGQEGKGGIRRRGMGVRPAI